MGKQTVINIKDHSKFTIITQQYEVGLYVAIYKEGVSMPDQCTSTLKEETYHRKLRKNYPDYIKEESSEIPEKEKKGGKKS